MLRIEISKMVGLREHQAFDQLELSLRKCFNESDLMNQA